MKAEHGERRSALDSVPEQSGIPLAVGGHRIPGIGLNDSGKRLGHRGVHVETFNFDLVPGETRVPLLCTVGDRDGRQFPLVLVLSGGIRSHE